MAKEAKQAEKLETKLKLLTQGYIVRADQLAEQVRSLLRRGAVRLRAHLDARPTRGSTTHTIAWRTAAAAARRSPTSVRSAHCTR